MSWPSSAARPASRCASHWRRARSRWSAPRPACGSPPVSSWWPPPIPARAATAAEASAAVRARVVAARQVARSRAGVLNARRLAGAPVGVPNARLAVADLEAACQPTIAARGLLGVAVDRLGLSARGFHRCLRVARTVADLAGDPKVDDHHVREALGLRHLALDPNDQAGAA